MEKQFVPSEQELQESFEVNAAGVREGDLYTGNNDVALDFGTASSFANEPSNQRTFTVDIKNTGTADVTLALCPGFYDSVAELNTEENLKVDYIIKDGEQTDLTEQNKTINCIGGTSTVKKFLKYVAENPLRIHSMIVKVTDEGMLDNPFRHKPLTAFDGGQNFKIITPADYVDEDTQNNKMATVDCQAEDLQFGKMRLVTITIPGKQSMKLTLKVGAIANRDLELERCAKVGRRNAARLS